MEVLMIRLKIQWIFLRRIFAWTFGISPRPLNNDELVLIYARFIKEIEPIWESLGEGASMRMAVETWMERGNR